MEILQRLAPPAEAIEKVNTFEKTKNFNGYESQTRALAGSNGYEGQTRSLGGSNGYENYWKGLSGPDHTQLPAEDGTFVKNFQEHPQSILITDSIDPVLAELHPDGQYAIGQDSGIYWRLPKPPEELAKGAEAPDWFYVPGVPPSLDGKARRSYVMWKERIPPAVVMEFVSGDGSEEKDKTPLTGKFWVYERIIQPEYYAIYFVEPGKVELYRLENGKYQLVPANERGHYPIERLGVELGIWQGVYQNLDLPWLRCWDSSGDLLLTGEERAKKERSQKELAITRAEEERQRAEEQRQRAEEERQRADSERLEKEVALKRAQSERERAESERLEKEVALKRAKEERKRAEEERQRAESERLEKELALKRAERLAAQLRALGIEPEEL